MQLAEDAGVNIADVEGGGAAWVPRWVAGHSFHVPVGDVQRSEEIFHDALEVVEIVGLLAALPVARRLAGEADDEVLLFVGEVVHGQRVIAGENRAGFKEGEILLVMVHVCSDGVEQAWQEARAHDADLFAERIGDGNLSAAHVVCSQAQQVAVLWMDETVGDDLVETETSQRGF